MFRGTQVFRRKPAGVPREATRTTYKFTQFTKIYIRSGLKLRRSVAPGLILVLADYLGYRFLMEATRSAAPLQKLIPICTPPPRLEAVVADVRMLFNYSGVPRTI